jgi:acrylyl-CoA reductase (NADPH)
MIKQAEKATMCAAQAEDKSFRAFRITSEDRVKSGITRLNLKDLSNGQVVIRTAYAGVNYKDALATTERGNVIRNFPRVGGSDASGWVVSSEDPAFKPGDEVLVYARGIGVDHDGGFSEFIRVPADWVIPLPAGLTLFEAAALGIAGFTAGLTVHLLQENGVKPGDGKVLVNGATGGVATMAIDMLSQRGYQVVAMTAKMDRAESLKQLGAIDVISPAAFSDSGKPLASALWSAALDSIGGQHLSWLVRTVAPRGVVASIGNVSGSAFSTSVLPFILRGVRLIGINVSVYLDIEQRLWERLSTDLKPRHLSANVQLISLDQLADHLESMLAAKTSGRTVVDFKRNGM